MTVPVVPEREQPEALTDILESIALEETALAHLINSEAQKIEKSLYEGLEHQISWPGRRGRLSRG